MAITEFSAALNQVATERGIPAESVLESIKTALISAYKKDFEQPDAKDIKTATKPSVDKDDKTEEEPEDNFEVDLNPDTGEAKILKEGKDVTPAGFGRIAAQTAKQVILQKIRETEKGVILKEFEEKIGTVVSGTIFRVENNVATLDLGKAHGILPPNEQVPAEQHKLNQRVKVLVKEIRETPKGTEIIVSRADPQFVERLFEQEVPEIASGTVIIEAIAREAGNRTKMAVSSKDERVDPVGSCVGQKGVRVQSIINELFGEKIDIVPYSPNLDKFIAASLSPAKVVEVELNQEEQSATVSVPEDQQSLAIGKEGQNARLANKLTKWKIDIKGVGNVFSDSGEKGAGKNSTAVKGIWDEEISKKKSKKKKKKTKKEDEPEEKKEEEKDEPKKSEEKPKKTKKTKKDEPKQVAK